MIDKEQFLDKVKTIFDETPHATIMFHTDFKQLDEWNSLLALSLIVLIEDNYSILISPDQIENSKTFEDLFLSINS